MNLQSQEEISEGSWIGLLDKAVCGTSDAPLIWGATIDEVTNHIGFTCCTFQQRVYVNHERDPQDMIPFNDCLIIQNMHEVKRQEMLLREEL